MICFFNYTDATGGVEVWSQYFINLLNQNGFKSKILTLRVSSYPLSNDSLNCKKIDINAIFCFIKYLVKNKYLIMHVNSVDIGFWALPLSMLFGIKYRYLQLHSAEKYQGLRYLMFLVAKFFASRIMAVSSNAAQSNHIIKYDLIRPLYDIENKIRTVMNDAYCFDLNVTNIVTVGNWRPVKNNKLILNLVSKLDSQICWYIIGNGINNEEQKIVNNLISSGYRICVIENCNNPINYLKNADIYIGPSRSEGFGLAIVEAQLLGLPLLISDAYPHEAILSLENLIRFSDNNNIDYLISSINKLLSGGRGVRNFINEDLLNKYNKVRLEDFNNYRNIINNDLSK